MMLEFKKEDFVKGRDKIRIAVPSAKFNELPEKVEVRSPFTGKVLSFVFDKAATVEYGMANEFWDGEESHKLYRAGANNPVPFMIDVVTASWVE